MLTRLTVFVLLVTTCMVAWSENDVVLRGAGATFPQPLYEKWIETYKQRTGVRITYEGVGSGKGIQRLMQKEVDFGGTDAFLSDEELASSSEAILHLPTCLGAVVVIYHLPGNPAVKLRPDVLADIFSGKIETWSHERIRANNSGISLPNLPIQVVHRSEGSGTTYIFTDYLCKVSKSWNEKIGRGKTVRWPAGMGVEGNPGVAKWVGKVPGSIGYVELTYAERNHLPCVTLMNSSGEFVNPSLESVSAAAEVKLPTDTRLMITDTAASHGYPISAFTYLIFYKEQSYNGRRMEKAKALKDFLWWVLGEGQAYNREMLYAPLPKSAVNLAKKILDQIEYDNEPF